MNIFKTTLRQIPHLEYKSTQYTTTFFWRHWMCKNTKMTATLKWELMIKWLHPSFLVIFFFFFFQKLPTRKYKLKCIKQSGSVLRTHTKLINITQNMQFQKFAINNLCIKKKHTWEHTIYSIRITKIPNYKKPQSIN